jgi:hypothetical protein
VWAVAAKADRVGAAEMASACLGANCSKPAGSPLADPARTKVQSKSARTIDNASHGMLAFRHENKTCTLALAQQREMCHARARHISHDYDFVRFYRPARPILAVETQNPSGPRQPGPPLQPQPLQRQTSWATAAQARRNLRHARRNALHAGGCRAGLLRQAVLRRRSVERRSGMTWPARRSRLSVDRQEAVSTPRHSCSSDCRTNIRNGRSRHSCARRAWRRDWRHSHRLRRRWHPRRRTPACLRCLLSGR